MSQALRGTGTCLGQLVSTFDRRRHAPWPARIGRLFLPPLVRHRDASRHGQRARKHIILPRETEPGAEQFMHAYV